LLGRAPGALVTWPMSSTPDAELESNFESAIIDGSFKSALREQLRSLPKELRTKDCEDFHEAVSIAHAVRGREFDIVECPDYLTSGRFLPFALAEYGVKYQRLVCSLHGRVSRTFEIENQFHEVVPPADLERLRQAERQLIWGAADVRYGFSDRYVKQTRALDALPVALVDPLCALPALREIAHRLLPGERRPGRIWFVARQDRFKGADLFLAAIFRAGEELWNHYSMCGPSVRFGNRVSVFEGMSFCRNRGMPFNYRGPLPYDQIVREVFDTDSCVVVPSREETFNLVAVEALLHGVPVLISKHAGATDFIRERFGNDFAGAVEFDPLDELEAAAAVRSMWVRLEEHREAVRRALDTTDLTARPESLLEAYESEGGYESRLRDDAFQAWDRLMKNLFIRRPSREVEPSETFRYFNFGKDDTEVVEASRVDGAARFALADAVLSSSPKENPMVALHQARRIAELSPYVNRVRIYRQLAACEEESRPMVAAAYRLRAFRMGGLREDKVELLQDELHRLGSVEEAACVRLWTESNEATWQLSAVTQYLEERRHRLLRVDLDAEEYVVDHRDRREPKVSVIVSMYDVALPVLRHFLAHLSRVAMVKHHRAEVVFVDSGSPAHQSELLDAIPASQELSWVLIRSAKRETIQTAWNRGLRASRGQYITCLGVDEGVTEFALDELSKYLDGHDDIDWVTADTVVTKVDEAGRWRRDVMSYSRPTYSRFNYFNDCTYINYVGGMYRRSIHRFGWYDGSFRGAGDTEFKCRIFPFIRTAALPKTLGFYFDYPSARVTNSANIEVEDLRAWYVFRTPGGIEYLMGEQDLESWEELFWTALSGRRCWAKTPADCDLTFAENVLRGLLAGVPEHRFARLAPSLFAINREMRLLQDWTGRWPWLGNIAEKDLIHRSRRFFELCARMRPGLTFPADFRSDAFFFAHSWTWQ
jgi:glycosyltransferase involved in cell wall biosynthesis